MNDDLKATIAFLETVHPYDTLPKDELARVAGCFVRNEFAADTLVYQIGEPLAGIFLIKRGGVEVLDRNGGLVSLLAARNTFGERGLMRDGLAATTAHTREDSTILMLPAIEFRELIARYPSFERFFNRGRGQDHHTSDISTLKVADLIARKPLSCAPDTPVAEAAMMMRDAQISSLGVTEGEKLVGILTVRDLANKVLAEGRSATTPVAKVMTAKPISLPPTALGTDILHIMLERKIGHLPIVEDGRFVGMITQTDLTRFQAVSSAVLVRDLAGATKVSEMAAVTARIPRLLVQLVGGNHAHEVVTRLITDIADTVTRRLLALAEAELGAAPVPYLWLACGSQGRQEQTGISDQDNCMIIHNNATPDDMVYFAKMAKIVSDGLNECGYVYCPGDMMATADRWRVRQKLWRDYFQRWIAVPSNEAQMLASVMFDLRPIGGTVSLYQELQQETLDMAAKNSIFVAHMIANSLKHAPPLGLIRGFATIRSGEHRNHIDMKHNGVVPVADLARVYALQGRLTAANTRARLQGAEAAGVISASGARDLIEAYDLIASMRLENQALLVRSGRKPDNFLSPTDLSDFERSHLRDAFVVVRTMQSALAHGKGAPG
ncbi:putative nucleotidyltransferase substrate binding domain-containing protein [Phaeovulum sp.]|uniref:putative nucleotidyltransferase substrate binding domain-containing protein n=1 Tax=Phaeovulum sp. TaxID=2934796 RepID=UPI00273048C9|nr:putative nucleotidyltransferase substrate binding domain-containing protein [Phaeovulum sp.]MDP1667952.1 putative nucleotidyltransferase substrate binding domain-containing protein [Phaeovulum sp.]MDZ4119402.1 putative nucleotidyltransferase substrate binding domain-containing protein [Phaeovulum sp.]